MAKELTPREVADLADAMGHYGQRPENSPLPLTSYALMTCQDRDALIRVVRRLQNAEARRTKLEAIAESAKRVVDVVRQQERDPWSEGAFEVREDDMAALRAALGNLGA